MNGLIITYKKYLLYNTGGQVGGNKGSEKRLKSFIPNYLPLNVRMKRKKTPFHVFERSGRELGGFGALLCFPLN
jgi:hypothetical protein